MPLIGFVPLIGCDRQADGDAQERCDLPRLSDESREQLPTRVLEQQGRPSTVMDELQGSSRPGGIERIPERIGALQPRKDLGSGNCPQRHDGEQRP